MSAFPIRLSPLSAALASTVVLSTFSFAVYAAGYGINENSASYMGTGFAGRASNPVDASIAANNPAGISFVQGSTVSLGTAVILEGGEFEGEYNRPPLPVGDATLPAYSEEGKTRDFQKRAPVPFGHFVMPVNDRFSFGLSGYGPFGIELDYRDDWPGRYFGDKTSVKVINLQGTLSYKPFDNFSVGFGLIGSYVDGKMTQKTGLPGAIPFNGNVEGDDKTLSWNIGALWRANDRTMIGIVYHAPLEFTLEGTVKVNGNITVPDMDLPGNIPPGSYPIIDDKAKASLEVTMPERAALSITHQLGRRWTVMADVTWTRWSRFEEFYIKAKEKVYTKPLPDVGPLGFDPSSYIPMKWKDVWAFSIGVSYQFTPQWLFRAGYMRDQSPVDNDNRTVRSPDSDRNWFTAGVNWKATDNLNFDLAYAYVDLKKGSISETRHNVPGSETDVNPAYGTLTGDYNNSSHIVAAQVNYRF